MFLRQFSTMVERSVASQGLGGVKAAFFVTNFLQPVFYFGACSIKEMTLKKLHARCSVWYKKSDQKLE